MGVIASNLAKWRRMLKGESEPAKEPTNEPVVAAAPKEVVEEIK